MTLTAATRTAQRAASTTVAPPAIASASAPQKASPAPVGVDRLDLRGAHALGAVALDHDGALGAERHDHGAGARDRASERDGVPAAAGERLELAAIGDEHVDRRREPARGRRVEHDRPARRGDGGRDRVPRHLVLHEHDLGRAHDLGGGGDVARVDACVGARADDDRVLAPRIDRDHRDSGRGLAILADVLDADALGPQALAQPRALRVGADAADHGHLAPQARRGHRLVGPLAARKLAAVAPDDRLARGRVALDGDHQVEVDRADDGDHRAAIAPMTRSQKRSTSSVIATWALGAIPRRPCRSTAVAPRVQRPSVSMATKVSTLLHERGVDEQRHRARVVHRRARKP